MSKIAPSRPLAPWAASLLLGAALVVAPQTSPAQENTMAQGNDFTFRRVVPGAGTGPRITVQIDPEEQARFMAARPSPQSMARTDREGPAPAPASSLAWFWDSVSPAIDDKQGRFLSAMSALNAPPAGRDVPVPRLQFLQEVAQAYGPDILRATVGTNVSPALVLAVIAVESAGRADAISHAGAQGLMQLIPATAARFSVTDAFDTGQNIRGGVAYLNWLLGHFDNDIVLALAGYNAGEGAVRRNAGVPPYAETRDYVPKVLASWLVARGLCATLPELPSDGCVFHIGRAG
ncbi:lytic transglycosylase domain-containing protein [Roseinatronobacter alkalisoli]|uniref:Lytic transglycosylase domain-containing protein n=1 Tax=Roseinatronobacter alkalisoli TaxID=3028235 RepID=A0ABT5T9E1_9RHOB|nr:lytic transglycosylase domain-containing protein [Roseinatronobacter sp. HJB301]MDD7971743.1 lytic transglycosylase domain-containing protein [Roseinatronobacter sp. HJB301]